MQTKLPVLPHFVVLESPIILCATTFLGLRVSESTFAATSPGIKVPDSLCSATSLDLRVSASSCAVTSSGEAPGLRLDRREAVHSGHAPHNTELGSILSSAPASSDGPLAGDNTEVRSRCGTVADCSILSSAPVSADGPWREILWRSGLALALCATAPHTFQLRHP